MTAENFAYWLQGFFELNGGSSRQLEPDQVEMIRRHLALVFVHDIDPKAGGPEMQAKLNEIHYEPDANADMEPWQKQPTNLPPGVKMRC